MSSPLLGADGQGQCEFQLAPHPAPVESGSCKCNYFGLPDWSSVDSSAVISFTGDNKDQLTLKAAEIRLGLPGSQSPERDPKLCLLRSRKLDEKLPFPLIPLKDGICLSLQNAAFSGHKRGFSYSTEDFIEKTYNEGNWMFQASGSNSDVPQSGAQEKFPVNGAMNFMLSSRPLPNLGGKSCWLLFKKNKNKKNNTKKGD
ncbi:hypothetical protein Nepgr_016536 [Nepenthes gracilis]|uniref:Uncharacterized protein n=1 Tax=Nepenthes gracilis TaxID=150966 RepID=A0AAD3SPX2_NEPGR|nr:hypothetical protein Nepgr_016536 [Nepenthes gracilis]